MDGDSPQVQLSHRVRQHEAHELGPQRQLTQTSINNTSGSSYSPATVPANGTLSALKSLLSQSQPPDDYFYQRHSNPSLTPFSHRNDTGFVPTTAASVSTTTHSSSPSVRSPANDTMHSIMLLPFSGDEDVSSADVDSAATEKAVRAHLSDDVESSFMRPLSPILHNAVVSDDERADCDVHGAPVAEDDTFLFDRPLLDLQTHHAARPAEDSQHADAALAVTPAAMNPDESGVSFVPATRLHNLSSPTAAATRLSRSGERSSDATPTGSFARSETTSKIDLNVNATLDPLRPTTIKNPHTYSVLGTPATPASQVAISSVANGSTVKPRQPIFLRDRVGSTGSSVSSLVEEELGSDITASMGADHYTLQSGGVVPMTELGKSLSDMLSQSISARSVTSGIDGPRNSGAKLDALGEIETPRKAPHANSGAFQTPQPTNKENLTAPTDTVIAAHVRNVQVPESLAKEYKFKSGLATPARASTSHGISTTTPVPGAKNGRKNLTLKEQSSTIERLSKENFDLKLKVMFLSDRLDKLSEEGIKEMISENVELRTNLAVLQRDNKMLRRRVKDLEKKLLDEEENRPGTARSGASSGDQTAHIFDQEAQEKEEELMYLRDRLEEYLLEINRLKTDVQTKESEKKRLTEMLRSCTDKSGDGLGRQEEADVWKDLLEQETARREQADDENRKLRDEIFKLKQDASGLGSNGGGLHHTTNIYNITKKARDSSPGRPQSELSGHTEALAGSVTTLVEDLRRESEQLRHENAELRREVGAQTSMLTSRNREKERLYQEIEDLKMAQRRIGPPPSTIDSLLDRSASRAGGHERSRSRGSATTRFTIEEMDAEREVMENKVAELRDKFNEVKLQNQELQHELNTCMEDFEVAIAAKRLAEENTVALQADMETAMNDLVALQSERDEALREQGEIEAEFEALRKEAQDEIDTLEAETDQRDQELQRLQTELQDRSENFEALQEEMRKMGEVLVKLEDEQDNKMRRIEELERELGESNKELEELEAKLLETNEKNNRLGIQLESSQGEVAFLREEQESDKMRIGDLEAALAGCEASFKEEKERAKELEDRLDLERRQRELVANKEKEEVQQFVNELNKEATTAKDEVRRLRKSLTSREVEATEWKERLIELENNLREALGDLNGTRSSLLQSIAQLQRELENKIRELDRAKASLVEKDRIVKQRDALLESHGLESRKLGDLLDKERQAHRNTKHQFETFQKTHLHVSRTVSTQDTRIHELESGRTQDKKKLAQLENQLRDQLLERNNLLLTLWTKLSALCGTDWAHDNSLINGRALPSVESVATMLPGFTKNLLAAVKTIESMLLGFTTRIKGIERDLYREYQTLEANLEVRTKKLDRLESLVRNSIAMSGPSPGYQAHMARLEEAYRQLKVENTTLRTANDVRARAAHAARQTNENSELELNPGSPAPSVPTGPREHEKKMGLKKMGSRTTSLTQTSSSPAANTNLQDIALLAGEDPESANGDSLANTRRSVSGQRAISSGSTNGTNSNSMVGSVSEHKWMLRLRDMESKMKKEREDRYLDRAAALQRLVGLETENRELRGEMARMKRASATD